MYFDPSSLAVNISAEIFPKKANGLLKEKSTEYFFIVSHYCNEKIFVLIKLIN